MRRLTLYRIRRCDGRSKSDGWQFEPGADSCEAALVQAHRAYEVDHQLSQIPFDPDDYEVVPSKTAASSLDLLGWPRRPSRATPRRRERRESERPIVLRITTEIYLN